MMIISILLISAFILYTNQPGGGITEQKEKPKEKPEEKPEEEHIKIKETKPRGADRFGFVCFNEYALKDLNLGWVRPHPGPFIWGRIERVKGKYDFSEADKVVKTAQEMGLNILATIWPYAEWDQKRWGKTNITVIEDFPELPRSRFKPYDMEAYRAFVKALVERYDGDGVNDMPGLKRPIKYWEVLNEPEAQSKEKDGRLECFFQGDASDFYDLLKATYEAIKEADPEATVIIGGAATLKGEGSREFLREVLRLGGGKYFDVAAVHSYEDEMDDFNVDELKSLLKEFNLEKPIWVTEVGPKPEMTRDDDAEFVKAAVRAFARGAEVLFFDHDPGVVMAYILGDFSSVKRIGEGTYRFDVNGEIVYVIWSPGHIPEEISGEVYVIDIYGKVKRMDVSEVRITEEPIYITASNKIAKRIEKCPMGVALPPKEKKAPAS